MEKHTNMIQVEQHVINQAAETLQALGDFAAHAYTIARVILKSNEQGDGVTILSMARMLRDLAANADNANAAELSTELCEMVYDQIHRNK